MVRNSPRSGLPVKARTAVLTVVRCTRIQSLRDALEQAHGEYLDLRRELARRGGLTPAPQ